MISDVGLLLKFPWRRFHHGVMYASPNAVLIIRSTTPLAPDFAR